MKQSSMLKLLQVSPACSACTDINMSLLMRVLGVIYFYIFTRFASQLDFRTIEPNHSGMISYPLAQLHPQTSLPPSGVNQSAVETQLISSGFSTIASRCILGCLLQLYWGWLLKCLGGKRLKKMNVFTTGQDKLHYSTRCRLDGCLQFSDFIINNYVNICHNNVQVMFVLSWFKWTLAFVSQYVR